MGAGPGKRGGNRLFAELVLRHGLLNRGQLRTLFDRAAKSGRSMADEAVANGLIEPNKIELLKRAIRARRVRRIDRCYARVLRDRGLVSQDLLERALQAQSQGRYEARLGELLVNARLLSMRDHTETLKAVLEKLREAPARRRPTDTRSAFGRRPPANVSGAGRSQAAKRAAPAKPMLEIRGATSAHPETEQDRSDSSARRSHAPREARARDSPASALPQRDPGAPEAPPHPLRGDELSAEDLMKSALTISLGGEDEELGEDEQELVVSDVKAAESLSRSGQVAFTALDAIDLSAFSGERFKPDEYFKKRRGFASYERLVVSASLAVFVSVLLISSHAARQRLGLTALSRELVALRADAIGPGSHGRIQELKTRFYELGSFALSQRHLALCESQLDGVERLARTHRALRDPSGASRRAAREQVERLGAAKARELAEGRERAELVVTSEQLRALRGRLDDLDRAEAITEARRTGALDAASAFAAAPGSFPGRRAARQATREAAVERLLSLRSKLDQGVLSGDLIRAIQTLRLAAPKETEEALWRRELAILEERDGKGRARDARSALASSSVSTAPHSEPIIKALEAFSDAARLDSGQVAERTWTTAARSQRFAEQMKREESLRRSNRPKLAQVLRARARRLAPTLADLPPQDR
jgi:hypothetical protein